MKKRKTIHRSDVQSIIANTKLQEAINLCDKLNMNKDSEYVKSHGFLNVEFRNGRYVPAV